MDESEDVVIVHNPILQILKERQDELLLAGVFQDELKEMTGKVKGITTAIVKFVLGYALEKVLDIEDFELHRGYDVLFKIFVLSVEAEALHDDSEAV